MGWGGPAARIGCERIRYFDMHLEIMVSYCAQPCSSEEICMKGKNKLTFGHQLLHTADDQTETCPVWALQIQKKANLILYILQCILIVCVFILRYMCVCVCKKIIFFVANRRKYTIMSVYTKSDSEEQRTSKRILHFTRSYEHKHNPTTHSDLWPRYSVTSMPSLQLHILKWRRVRVRSYLWMHLAIEHSD